jgi:hypothetical protein
MRSIVLLAAVLACMSLGMAKSERVISAHGIRVVVPSQWDRIRPAEDGSITDPRTLLVAGTQGVRPRNSRCQVAAYRIPASGAVVVIVGWKATSGGGHLKPGRAPLKKLVAVHRPSFECFRGRGALAQVVLAARAYQVNVLVGDRASKERIEGALAVGRSFDLVR